MSETRMMAPVAQMAKLFNVTERRVQQLASDGIIPRADRGRYHIIESVMGYVKFLQERAYGKSATVQDSHYERTRYLKSKADLTELELAERAGKLVDADDVRKLNFKNARLTRNNLQTVADRVAPLVAAESDQKICWELINADVDRSLKAVAALLESKPIDDADLDITRKTANDQIAKNIPDGTTDAGESC